MRSKPLKSTSTAATVSKGTGREGVCDNTWSRKSVAPSAVHTAMAKCAIGRPPHLPMSAAGR